MRPFVDVRSLRLRFETGEKDILSNINFQLHDGESVLLLGPSGSGKSTLTSCLNGLFPRELDGEMEGDIFIDGKKTIDYRPGELSKQVGVVFQDPETQFCMLNVEDEVAFGLENIGVPFEEMEEKIEDALELVDMQDYKESAIATLSGGQKQKLALACILALKPSLLILDEPTANLDPIATKDLIETIKNLREKIKFGLVIIEHKLDDWTDLAERCLLLNREGEIFNDSLLRTAIRNNRSQLVEQGIWLPKVAQFFLKDNPDQMELPLTVEEFAAYPSRFAFVAEKRISRNSSESGISILETRNIAWSARKRDIIKDVSLSIYEGEFIAIVGANGSGKTTLSRILSGIQKPASGSISLKGKALKEWKESLLRQEIGYVFQNPEHQFITNTVYDEVAFSLKMKNEPAETIREKVYEILDTFGLLELKNEHPFSLSQGQKRRLSVATMIVDGQSFLLLDEPTFGQDAQSNAELMRLLQQRHERGATILMITHDMEIVDQYASRVVVMNNGEVVADCTPESLWDKEAKNLKAWQLELPVSVQIKKIHEEEAYYVSTTS
ncbi:ABC transporter ATP-binding protein [Oceanobacillus saliphilus]|uniref:ABC transporter ATP-binding protein n=1 Tax=Oceanobacillus saliphilus TaxID=2925834 RepID=UPI00201E6601|nr:ABC transporter ATP-binding protein [Oceanobacillus saliphilus]